MQRGDAGLGDLAGRSYRQLIGSHRQPSLFSQVI